MMSAASGLLEGYSKRATLYMVLDSLLVVMNLCYKTFVQYSNILRTLEEKYVDIRQEQRKSRKSNSGPDQV